MTREEMIAVVEQCRELVRWPRDWPTIKGLPAPVRAIMQIATYHDSYSEAKEREECFDAALAFLRKPTPEEVDAAIRDLVDESKDYHTDGWDPEGHAKAVARLRALCLREKP
jgi:hypothetical protein